MNTIKMVAKLGDHVIPVGNCSSAQARILVRDDLAAWQDGTLVLFVRKAHAALLDGNDHLWTFNGDDKNTSQAELDRRKGWFLSFMPKAVAALSDKRDSEIAVIQGATASMLNAALQGLTYVDDPNTPPMPDEEVAEWFDDPTVTVAEGTVTDVDIEFEYNTIGTDLGDLSGLEVLWATDPDVTAAYDIREPKSNFAQRGGEMPYFDFDQLRPVTFTPLTVPSTDK